jgi:hypothetical protein
MAAPIKAVGIKVSFQQSKRDHVGWLAAVPQCVFREPAFLRAAERFHQPEDLVIVREHITADLADARLKHGAEHLA